VGSQTASAGSPSAHVRDSNKVTLDQLPQAVVGDITTAIGPHQRRADVGRVDEDVVRRGPDAERVDGRVLQQQQVLVVAVIEEPALQGEGLVVGDPAQPADAQRSGQRGGQSSASQSRVSSTVLIRSRKLAA